MTGVFVQIIIVVLVNFIFLEKELERSGRLLQMKSNDEIKYFLCFTLNSVNIKIL